MRQLTQAGRRAIGEIAERHGFSVDATRSMLDSVLAGNGRMAQFSHPEFGGSGQWMSGGMTMVSNLFDDRLKSRVAELCRDLSELVAREPGLIAGASFQSQAQGGGDASVRRQEPRDESESGSSDAGRLFEPAPADRSRHWWPAGLGSPSSSGAQNGMRYAFFPEQRRLAIEENGRLTVYDTQDHEINGASQQQSAGRSATFTSQHGQVDLASLHVVSSPDDAASCGAPSGGSSAPRQQQQQQRPPNPSTGDAPARDDVYSAIEKLAGLRAKGVLSDEEFAAKKTELLSRI